MRVTKESTSKVLNFLGRTYRALWLDRDGAPNVDCGYMYRVVKLGFVGDLFEFCRAAYLSKYALDGVTNQKGPGGIVTRSGLTRSLREYLRSSRNIEGPLEKVYFSSAPSNEGRGVFKKADVSRKLHLQVFFGRSTNRNDG